MRLVWSAVTVHTDIDAVDIADLSTLTEEVQKHLGEGLNMIETNLREAFPALNIKITTEAERTT